MAKELVEDSSVRNSLMDLEILDESPMIDSDEYVQLQLRIYRLTIILTAFSTVIVAFFYGVNASISLFLGALSGILYLRLLARGIGKLGKSARMVSKIQLLVPTVLVLVVLKLPQLQLLPALLGFLLYKSSLVIQFLIEPWLKKEIQ